MDEADENLAPGIAYVPFGTTVFRDALSAPASGSPVRDQWGVFLTGAAPISIKSTTGSVILGIDIEVSQLYEVTRSKFLPWILAVAIICLLVVFSSIFRHFHIIKRLRN